jgi:hypothetical protein
MSKTDKIIQYISDNIDAFIAYSPRLLSAFLILILGHYFIKYFKKIIDKQA